jgi:hypothetical protein
MYIYYMVDSESTERIKGATMKTLTNDKEKAGQLASKKVLFGEFNRYAIAPVYTRFDSVSWFVWDANKTDSKGKASIIRQEVTKELALTGL